MIEANPTQEPLAAANEGDTAAASEGDTATVETAEITGPVVPPWLADAKGPGALAGLVRLELPEGALPWRDTMEEAVLRRRVRYTAGVELIARNFGALEPFAWDGDALLLVFGGIPAEEIPLHTFKVAREIWSRVRAELDLPVKVAAHAGRVRAGQEPGLVEGAGVVACGELASTAAPGTVVLSEEIALALPEADRQEIVRRGAQPGKDRFVYTFPPSAASSTVIDEPSRLWGRFREYAMGPGVRLVPYAGFRLHKRQPPRLDIRDVFIPSEVELRRRARLEPRFLQERQALGDMPFPLPWNVPGAPAGEHVVRELGDIFAKYRSVVLLGDPGSGKTTLLRWLAVIAASGSFTLDARLGVAERLLPLPVSVGRLAEVRRGLGGEGVSVLTALARYFHDRSVHEDEAGARDFLVRELESGHCVVLLDGLDEVKGEERQAIYQWLESFAAGYPLNRFVVSSRLVGYAGFQLPGDMVEAVLRPFTKAQVERYVRAFHRAYIRWETDTDATGEPEAERLLEALGASPRLQALATNPFMLSAFSLIHRAEGKLPRHRVQAYQVFAEALCETWAESRRLVAAETRQPKIEYIEEALPILGELALAMHEQHPTGVAPEDFVLRKIGAVLTQEKKISGADADRAAREFLRRAGEEVQILLERGAGAWGFLHLTFQEFFVAAGLHAKEEFESVAMEHLFDPRWEEVIRLGVGYMALVQKRPKAAEKFVRRVFDHAEHAPRAFFTEVLQKQVPLAALLAAEAGDALPVALQEQIAKRLAEWVRRMPRALAGPFLEELVLTDFAPRVIAACVPLATSGNAEGRARILLALRDLRATGTEELLLAALSDENGAVRDAAVEAIRPLFSSDVLQRLELSLSDPRPEVRAAALKAQEPPWVELPAAVLEKVLRDPDEAVRAQAVSILRYRTHEEAREAANTLQHDESGEVRRSLSDVLAQFGDEEWIGRFLLDEREEFRIRTALAVLTAFRTVNRFVDILRVSNDTAILILWNFLAPLHYSTEDRLANLSSPDPQTRAGNALQLRGVEEALEPLLALVDDPDSSVREQVILALGTLSSEQALTACMAALQDPDFGVRTAAAIGLARYQRKEALPVLLDVLSQAPDEQPRRSEVVRALGDLSAREALEPLLDAAQDPKEHSRWAIYEAVGRLASLTEVSRLVSHLEDQEQPSKLTDLIHKTLWAIADREARRTPEPGG